MPVVALAAAAWGLDGLLRKPLATTIHPATVVLWEHLIVVACVLPVIPAALRTFRRCSPRERVAIMVIGIGSSAVATALFTEAFALSAATGDFISPLVLQKLQPIFAVLLAMALLGERVRAAFGAYAVPAIVGAWLLAFPSPLSVSVTEVEVALCAVGAAALWAAGTVLGRFVSPAVDARDLTVLRYCWGLVGAVAVAAQQHAPVAPGVRNVPGLLLLALVPGLGALLLYYVGLRRTAASRATFAELAFPVTAAVVGVAFLGSTLSGTQWAGMALVVGAVSALGLRERRPSPVVVEPVRVPAASTG
ncbi:MAG: DMT family transporter [Motilibacteraceae bacterium]